MNKTLALIYGAAAGGLAYSYGPEDEYQAIPLGASVGILVSLITGMGSNYRSQREAALEAKKHAEALKLPSDPEHRKSRLHTVLAMSVEEMFDAIAHKLKSHGAMGVARFCNLIARLGRVIMISDFLKNLANVLSNNGFYLNLTLFRDFCFTGSFALPVQTGEKNAFDEELVGKPDDAEGHIAYLLAKLKIGDFFSHFFTPKHEYEYGLVFAALCEFDEALNDDFVALKSTLAEAGLIIPENTLILSLHKQVTDEYDKTINRLAEWIRQDSQAKLLGRLKYNHPEFTPYIEIFKSPKPVDSTSGHAFEFKGKDYDILKDLEKRIFQTLMHRLVTNKWTNNETKEDRALIAEYELLEPGKYPISQEALDLLKRFGEFSRFQTSMHRLITDRWISNENTKDRAIIAEYERLELGKYPISQGALDLLKRFEEFSIKTTAAVGVDDKKQLSTKMKHGFFKSGAPTENERSSINSYTSAYDDALIDINDDGDDLEKETRSDDDEDSDEDREKNPEEHDDKDRAESYWTGWVAKKFGYS